MDRPKLPRLEAANPWAEVLQFRFTWQASQFKKPTKCEVGRKHYLLFGAIFFFFLYYTDVWYDCIWNEIVVSYNPTIELIRSYPFILKWNKFYKVIKIRIRFGYKPVCSRFVTTYYVTAYKTIYMYYLKKSHDTLNMSHD